MFEAHKGGRIYACRVNSVKYIYASYMEAGSFFLLHRDIMDSGDLVVDHIVHGTISFVDNRRSNLRAVTNQQNLMNTGIPSNNKSGIKGVCWDGSNSRWRSQIKINGKTKTLGLFDNIEIAIGVRQQAEREYYGEYAYKGGEA